MTYKGKPLETGSIQFIPAKGRSASGVIKEGNFVMSTYDELDGAIPGKHAVIISAYKEVKVAGSTEPEQVLIVPEKYANAASSGLTVEIPSGGKKDIELKLSGLESRGGVPEGPPPSIVDESPGHEIAASSFTSLSAPAGSPASIRIP